MGVAVEPAMCMSIAFVRQSWQTLPRLPNSDVRSSRPQLMQFAIGKTRSVQPIIHVEDRTWKIGWSRRHSPTAKAGIVSTLTRDFTLALVTNTTDAITIALPARMYLSTFSCSTNHPRNTATTGFT
jgi:hypothetical protein